MHVVGSTAVGGLIWTGAEQVTRTKGNVVPGLDVHVVGSAGWFVSLFAPGG